MASLANRFTGIVATLWRSDAPLTATGLLMLGALAASLVGLAVDPRIITGAAVWLKPTKFAASMAIFTLTLAWMFTYLRDWPRARRYVGWTTAVTLILELVIIDVQAWRGTTSHFNVGTPLDLALWVTMGLAIVLQTVMSMAVAVALWRQPFRDRALGWALRLGVSITILGASSGGLMTQPTAAQLADARTGRRMTVVGAHTVGAPDGGAGLPGTGWSRQHGDLRVPHFIGLHAMQVVPLFLLLLRGPRWTDAARVRLTLTAAGSYTALFVLLIWQALRGQAVMQPDTGAVATLAAWAVLTVTIAWIAATRSTV